MCDLRLRFSVALKMLRKKKTERCLCVGVYPVWHSGGAVLV